MSLNLTLGTLDKVLFFYHLLESLLCFVILSQPLSMVLTGSGLVVFLVARHTKFLFALGTVKDSVVFGHNHAKVTVAHEEYFILAGHLEVIEPKFLKSIQLFFPNAMLHYVVIYLRATTLGTSDGIYFARVNSGEQVLLQAS